MKRFNGKRMIKAWAALLIVGALTLGWNLFMPNVYSGQVLPIDNVISLTLDFPSPIITKIKIQGLKAQEFDRVTMEGTYSIGKRLGEPVLPLKSINILIPFGREVEGIEIIHGDKVTLEGSFVIQPKQRSVPLSWVDKMEPISPNDAVYNSTVPYPRETHSTLSIQNLRGFKVLPVNLYPVVYIPKNRQLYYYPSMIVNVCLSRTTSSTQRHLFRGLPEDRKWLKEKVINPESINTYPQFRMQNSITNAKYVIVTSKFLKDYGGKYNWQALTVHKNSKGITTEIVTTEWIYENYDGTRPDGGSDHQTQIRNFIIDAYRNWGTEYILLGGDGDGAQVFGYEANVGESNWDDIIPAREFYCDTGDFDDNIPADLYYACLDGSFDYNANGTYGETGDGPNGEEVDLYAEIFIGRAPVDSEEELSHFVKKSLTYERLSQPSYLRLAYMLGEDLEQWCAAYLALKDKEGDINLIREFRDRVLMASREGRRYIELYYRHSAQIARLMLQHPSLLSHAIRSLQNLIPIIRSALNGTRLNLPEHIKQDIQTLLDNFAMYSSPNLRATISKIKEDLESGELVSVVKKPHSQTYLSAQNSDDSHDWGGDHKDEVKDGSDACGFSTVGFASSSYFKVSTMYDRDMDPDWTKEELIEILNSGVHILNHMGHANVDYCMKMDNSDVDSLTNTDYFFAYSQGCYSGSFDNRDVDGNYSNSDCILEHFTTGSYGAFAFIGNSRYGLYEPGSTCGPSQYFDRQFWDAVFGENILNLGKANQDSKEDNCGYTQEDKNNYMRWCYYTINLFGDPETSLTFKGEGGKAMPWLQLLLLGD